MGIFRLNKKKIKNNIDSLLKLLFPINRSITGQGNRETLNIIKEIIPINIHEVPSGSQAFDWLVPKEWKVNKAYLKEKNGKEIVNFLNNNLHLVNYSIPINKTLTYDELVPHIHTLKNQPNAIPYRTTYYNDNWGFCMAHNDYLNLDRNKLYEVFIDTELKNGNLTYADYYVHGKSKKEFMFSTYFCHPSMANDNLSGLITQSIIASELSKIKPYHSYRFVFVPETIGAIVYCKKNYDKLKKLEGGFILSNVGGPGNFSYKQSYNKNHYLNEIIKIAFDKLNIKYKTFPFDIHGSDERQYSSNGLRLNMPSVHKDKYYEYNEYHTSEDNLDFVKSEFLMESLNIYEKIIEILEKNKIFKNKVEACEVHLSKHDLYPKTSGFINQKNSDILAQNELDLILWLLFLCDGTKDLIEISKEKNLDIFQLFKVVENLQDKGLLSVAN